MIKIYLAAPYSNKDEKIKLRRVKIINQYAAKLIKTGNYIVFSPISHSHGIAVDGGLDGNYNFWELQDKEFIKWADVVLVLQIDGWDLSNGIKAEMHFAKLLGKKIVYKKETIPEMSELT